MQIKDIVNRDRVTLTNCEHEPIHIPGSIQPHGFLLGLTKKDLIVTFCSGNVDEYLGVSHEQLLEKSFETVFGTEPAAALRAYTGKPEAPFAAPLHLRLLNKPFSCVVQSNNNGVLVAEFERLSDDALAVTDVYRQTAQFTGYMQRATTLQSLCQAVADETRAITGYDRVMIYRFDEAYNGEVFAESCVENVEPFLGLHYPHTDIPAQARELYVKNLLRLIVDIHYTPVPIYSTEASATHAALDLSFSTLRSVSPIHVQYLNNMGVGATLTLSLLHEGKLWGLIACHHYSPKYIGYDTRMAAQLQAHFLTSQISVRQVAEEYKAAQKITADLEALLAAAFATESRSLEQIVQQENMLSFAGANGAVLLVDDMMYANGLVPPEEETRKLSRWLYTQRTHNGFSTAKLSALYPEAAGWCGAASGVVYHSLGAGAGNCFILFRAEVLREVRWAGNPEKAIEKDAHGLSPRKSFALWKETKSCESSPWLKPELTAIATVSNALQRHVYLLHLRREEQRQRRLSEKLREANAELENINWIGSHDLKEPLRKIQIFASRILDSETETGGKQLKDYVARMNESAKRMQNLITDMLAYSRLNHISEGAAQVNLPALVEGVLHELQFEAEQKAAVVEIKPLPVVQGVPVLLRQLFVNLLSNALKFSKPGVPPHVRISAESIEATPPGEKGPVHRYQRIAVTDNGIGFDEQYKDQIFQVFKKLHNKNEYAGTGVGLALSKKIMQNHGGFIDVTSEVGKGTTFWLYFLEA